MPRHITSRQDCDEPVIWRKDDLPAYQLAVVVDDRIDNITRVVRGSDLLDSTGEQLLLQRYLGMPNPEYLHHPVICNADGRKLSKQNRAAAINSRQAAHNLRTCLELLGQTIPETRQPASILAAAIANWNPELIPKTRTITMQDIP